MSFASNTFRYALTALSCDEQWASRWVCNKRVFVILQFYNLHAWQTLLPTSTRPHVVQNDVQARAFCGTPLDFDEISLNICFVCNCLSMFGRKTKFSDRLDKMSLWMRESKVHYEWIVLKHNWTGAVSSRNTCHLVNVIRVAEQMSAYSAQRWSSIFPSVSDYTGYNGCEWSEVKRSWRRMQTLPLNQLSIYFPLLVSEWVSLSKLFSYFCCSLISLTWMCHDIFTLVPEKLNKKERNFPKNENNALV